MKTAKLIVLFILIFSVSCNSQQPEKIENSNLKTVNKNKMDSIESKMLNHLVLRNNAFKNNDIKNIYRYTHPSELNKQFFEEFEKESQEYINTTKRDKLSVKNFKVLKVGKITQCNSEYQCLVNLRTTMIMDKDEFSFDRKIIAISKDGNEWKFVNGGENNFNTIKKLYPFICLSE